jgi:hypothetical protein
MTTETRNNKSAFSCAILLSLLLLLLSSCHDPVQPPPPVYVPSIVLTVEGVAVNEAYMRVHFTDTAGVKMFTLIRNGAFLCAGTTHSVDTVVSDTTVLRGTTYYYHAYRLRDTVAVDSSKVVPATTLDTASVTVSGVDVGVTDAYLRITMNDRNPIRGFVLKRGSATILSGRMAGRDTVVYDAGLAQNSSYTYKVLRTYNEAAIDSSLPGGITTLDTTSHNWTWQIDTLGYLTSHLFDAAIINDNDFWVVGSVYLGPSQDPYCIGEWKPGGWNLKRLYYTKIDNGTQYQQLIAELRMITAFSSTDMWLNGVVHWDGKNVITHFLPPSLLPMGKGIENVWGTSGNNLWAACDSGFVLHFDGANWTSIPTGITSDLKDVWGSHDGRILWFCGWYDFQPTSLLRYRDGKMETIFNNSDHLYSYDPNHISGAAMSVWANSNYRVFPLTWFNLYESSTNTHGEGKALNLDNNSANWSYNRVRGNGVNDIVAVGYDGLIWHYNGKSWKVFSEIANQNDILRSVAIKGNLIIAVGNRYYDGIHYYGVVYKGRRN